MITQDIYLFGILGSKDYHRSFVHKNDALAHIFVTSPIDNYLLRIKKNWTPLEKRSSDLFAVITYDIFFALQTFIVSVVLWQKNTSICYNSSLPNFINI